MHKLKHTVILILSCFLVCAPLTHAQEKSYYERMLEEKIKLAQRPGTESALRNYLSVQGVNSDTVTAFFLIPGACPRCEALVAGSLPRLRALRPHEKVMIVAVHEDAEAAAKYVEELHWGEDYLVLDTDNHFDSIFSTTMGGLQGLIIARLDLKNGRLITGGEYSYASDQFFKDFFAVSEPFPFHVFDELVADYKQNRADGSTIQTGRASLLKYDAYSLETGDNILTNIRNSPIIRKRRLVLVDDMFSTGFHFKCVGNHTFTLQERLLVDSASRDTFITLPPEVYADSKKFFRYMPLDAVFMPDDKIAMSYSLPEVFIEKDKGERSVAFYNAPTFLVKALTADHWETLTGMENNDFSEWMNQHYRIFPSRPGYVVMTCHRMVWPLMPVEDRTDAKTNPFLSGFYDQSNPYALEMELATGRVVKHFGQLEEVFKQTRTGYWYTDVVADAHGGKFIYGNQVAGKLYLTNVDDLEHTLRTYEVFSLPVPPEADSKLLYKDEYVYQFDPYFSRYIQQVSLDDKYINCLVCKGLMGEHNYNSDVYEFVRLSRKSGQVVNRYTLAPEREDERLLAYGLTADDKGNRPFYISKQGGKYWVKFVTARK